MNQWMAMSQDALKKISEAQKNGMSQLGKNPTLDVGGAAEMMKASMQSMQQMTSDSTAALNTMISNQATSLKLGVSAEATQQLMEIIGTITNNAIQQQTKLANDCVKPFTTFVAQLSQVKNAEDLTGLQSQFAEDLGKTLKTGATDNAQLLSSLQSAMTSWTENTLDKTAG
jgi:hypothetical protein